MTAINLQMFGTPKAVYQSSNINQLSPELGNIAYQVNDSLLAGNNVSSTYYTTTNTVALNYGITGSQSAKIYANQLIPTTVGGWDDSDNPKRGEFTPFAKGDFSHLSKEANYPHWKGLIGVTTQGRIEFLESIKKGGQSATLGNVDIKYRASENYKNSIHLVIGKDDNLELIQKCAIHHLHLWVIVGYSDQALAKSSVRIGVLNLYKATHDAPSVFFCVHAYAHLLNAVLYRTESMVAAAEQPKGWLVSLYASNANSTVVTTPEIGVSGGDSLVLYKEIIVMMATPTQTQFKFLFLSIKRSDTTAKPCRIAVTAPNEHDARLMLVRDYILSFAGRLPAQEVAHA
ncbi:host cell division inhibitor Icd-like protein [Proteus mirabilis]|uniref:host cell division inhibitor Icd-like protein n=1 Tax=Proteus mirabilis TaxID=584 RepID=UPI0023F9F796|nr:host cell division inhibitor Icd-like protein [Proteus mirabilis]MDF7170570.1 host cell division inhibitor Icd-like protein [Proteus mirabilis]MDF7283641.1 host cell division inhibitor Icd-like protein [Proteus mirabilis]MDF7380199.1 host cell division inhibitor Icd-like protein [Proteus mirabilis]MDF7394189.1 host cell division inhibitor Icd-like protein [Proteus mirabilis]MEC3991793.1 host cell division inhibitor Icd-like protein [Proteus mirabilis]